MLLNDYGTNKRHILNAESIVRYVHPVLLARGKPNVSSLIQSATLVAGTVGLLLPVSATKTIPMMGGLGSVNQIGLGEISQRH